MAAEEHALVLVSLPERQSHPETPGKLRLCSARTAASARFARARLGRDAATEAGQRWQNGT